MIDFEDDIKECIRVLETGGIILYPTDTVWGIGCDALNEQAIDKVFEVKHRPREKSLIVLLADAKDILQYIAAPHPDIIDIVEQFGTPTTVIYDDPLGFAYNAVSENGTIAIRIPDDPFCTALLKRFRRPIISTSANISGKPTAGIYKDIDPEIVNAVDYVVKYRQNDEELKKPSRLVKINEDGSLLVLRP
jgi:L-threonylcarbamoyladenylate synthase